MNKGVKKRFITLRVFCAVLLIVSATLNVFIYGDFFKNTQTAHAETIVIGTDNAAEALFKEKFANAPDGTVLDLNGNQSFTVRVADNKNWLINNHNIKVVNGSLNLRSGGIICNGDLTFENVQLNLNKTDGAVIVANGHNLTFNNVTKYSGNITATTIFGGTVVNSSETIPAAGNWSQTTINITGKNDLGKIFMGNYDAQKDGKPLASGMADYGKTFSSCTVNIDENCTQYASRDNKDNRAVYASGGYMAGQNNFVATPNACPMASVRTENAVLNTYDDLILTFDGETGRNNKGTFNFSGSEYAIDNVSLSNLRTLRVKSGKFVAKADITFAQYMTTLGVESSGFLYAGNLGNKTFTNFEGGGTLNLGKSRTDTSQTLTIADTVSGSTEVEFGNTVGFPYAGVVDSNYIVAPKSGADAFKVSNPASNQQGYWNRDSSGNWLFSSTKPGEHKHVYGDVYSFDENDHWYQCIDAACPDVEGSKIGLAAHEYEDDHSRKCLDCDYKRVIIDDIFFARDDSKMELLKERVFNSLLHSQASIDVSDLNLTYNDITYTSKEGNSSTGTIAARTMVREHPFFSTLCTTGDVTFEYSGNIISKVNYTLAQYTWKPETISLALEAYDEAMALITLSMNTVQKLAVIHDWVCEHITYSQDSKVAPMPDFAIGGLAYGGAVCGGYSQTMQFLLDQLDIESVYVQANTPKEPHAWNLVKVDGYWFHIDTTWDDGVAGSNSFHHTFFLLNDDEFKESGDDDDGDGVGTHGTDWLDQKKYPANTDAYFDNKYWSEVSGKLTNNLLSQDPKLTVKKEEPDPAPGETEAVVKFSLPSSTKGSFKVFSNGVEISDGAKVKEGSKIFVVFATTVNNTNKTASLVDRIIINGIEIFSMKDYPGFGSFSGLASEVEKTRTSGEYVLSKIDDMESLDIVVETQDVAPIYRLYNEGSSEHFYTSNFEEYELLTAYGWEQEGVAWLAPVSGTKIHRLYNEGLGSAGRNSHYYTSDLVLIATLVSKYGWRDEGVLFYGGGATPIYHAYSEALKSAHLYTSSLSEYRGLDGGWDKEPATNGFMSEGDIQTSVGSGILRGLR